ncbi:hypothetical protein K3495_g984 [Podosphaera aphanis]|nr:hypothetical protein K3495_g984 [Podosphaera aphanis]
MLSSIIHLAAWLALFSLVQAEVIDIEPKIFVPQTIKRESYNATTTVFLFTSVASQITPPTTSPDDYGYKPSPIETDTSAPPVETIPAPITTLLSSHSEPLYPTQSAVNSTAVFPSGGSMHATPRLSSGDLPSSALSSTTTPKETPRPSTDRGETSINAPATTMTSGALASPTLSTGFSPDHSVAPSSLMENRTSLAGTSPATISEAPAITSTETTSLPASISQPSGYGSSSIAVNATSTAHDPSYSTPETSLVTSPSTSLSSAETFTTTLSLSTSASKSSSESSDRLTSSYASQASNVLPTASQNATYSTTKDTTSASTSIGQLPLTGNSTSTVQSSDYFPISSTSSSYGALPSPANSTLTSTSLYHTTSDSSTLETSSTDYTSVYSTAMPTAYNQTSYSITFATSATRTPTVIPVTSNGTVSSTSVYPSSSSPSQSIIPINSNATSIVLPTGTAPLTSSLPSSTPASTQKSSTVVSTTPALTVVLPTATNSHSTFIPSSIIAQTSATHSSDETTTTSMQTGIPSALPKIVQNPNSSSTPAQPVDTTEVQIGFQWALNYPFVVSHPLSTSQIFTYLPLGIADGLGLKPEQIVVKNLLPLDTTAELQFITTVARIFIPTSMVDTLRVDLGIPVSPIYQNPDESVNTLMNYINPAIPFFPGAIMDPGSYPSSTEPHPKPTASDGNSVFNTGSQQSQSSSAKGTTAGIALAAFGGAAAYGAAMFLLARRYKRRKQRRSRADSFTNTSGTREFESPITPNFGDGGALMSGGRSSPTHDRHSRGSGRTGNTARTAQISAPMMSENSLGWN